MVELLEQKQKTSVPPVYQLKTHKNRLFWLLMITVSFQTGLMNKDCGSVQTWTNRFRDAVEEEHQHPEDDLVFSQ